MTRRLKGARMTYRNDPAWIAARADYTAEHPGETPTAALMRRNAAAHRMFTIETTAERPTDDANRL